jgi:BolA protein
MGAKHDADKELTDQKNALSRAARMSALLERRFAPGAVSVVDDSARHAGHAGALPGGETHYRVQVASDAFVGLSRLDRQRLVNNLLSEEFKQGLHALSLDLKTLDEAKEAGRA